MTHPLHAPLMQGLDRLQLTLAQQAPEQLLAYLDLIARWTQVYNLTAVRQPADMLSQHLLDCLAVVSPMAEALADTTAPRLLDVGSGAGLPGVVLAICQPAWQVHCVDTVGKKASFIRQVGAELRLPNLQAHHARVERLQEAPFDLITSRAFASLEDFVGLTAQHLAPGGRWAAMKAKLTDDERTAVAARVKVLRVQPLQVPQLDADRCLVWMAPSAA